jgi:hypothetical protein
VKIAAVAFVLGMAVVLFALGRLGRRRGDTRPGDGGDVSGASFGSDTGHCSPDAGGHCGSDGGGGGDGGGD